MRRKNANDIVERIYALAQLDFAAISNYRAGFEDALAIIFQYIKGSEEELTEEYLNDEWVSASDRLPRSHSLVLFKAPFLGYIVTYIGYYDEENQMWIRRSEMLDCEVDGVTEWKMII